MRPSTDGTPARFVVLIGKGTYDFKDVYAKGDNLMTPLMAATPNGLYASDNRIADVKGGDDVPDVIGEAIATALERYAREEQLSFLLSIYNLLGDPATRIR